MKTKKYEDINFEPLRSQKQNIPIKAIVIGFATSIVITAIATIINPLFIALALLLYFLGFLILVAWIVWSVYLSQKKFNETLKNFAKINNFSYIMGKDQNDSKRGTIFSHGRHKTSWNIIAGDYNNLSFELYSYNYTTGSGESSKVNYVQIFEITLPRKLPHIVIDSLIESGTSQGSVLPIIFDSSQKIELEGDFYKYFALYAPDKYGVTALTLIAPDVMETLMQFAAKCDIEIIDNKLYFIWPETPRSYQQYKDIFNTVDKILDQIQKKLISGNIYTHSTQAKLYTTPYIKTSKLKIFGSMYEIMFFALCIVGGLSIKLFGLSRLGVLIIVVLCFIYVLFAIFSHARKKQLLKNFEQRRYQ
ncbi:hypothetical protein KC950_01480 [Candidatus Saccharibacteria bacterium]|nr:hypothetical protein [Candidatus Saccharibacteria bacterium]